MAVRPSVWVSLVVALAVCGALWIHGRSVSRIERLGGLRLSYVVVGNPSEQVIEQTKVVLRRRADMPRAGRDVTVRSSGERIVLDVTAATEEDIQRARDEFAEIGELQFKRVDDEVAPFEALARSAKEEDLPRGLRFEVENAPVGPGRTKPNHFAKLVRVGTEDQRAALARFRSWASTIALPPDREIGFERLYEFDDATDAPIEIGWRTYVLFSKPALTSDAVRDAQARPEAQPGEGWFVSIELTPEGATRFEELTASNIKRRFAIVLDGIVESAPVVQSAIKGGHAQVTMGFGSPDAQLHDARKLELVLRSGALPAPIRLDSEQRIDRSMSLYASGALLPAAASLASIVFFALLALDRAHRARQRASRKRLAC